MKTILLMMSLMSAQVFAFYEPHSTIMPLKERFQVTGSKEELASERAHNLVGHMSLAVLSMDWQFVDSSLDHLQKAKVIAKKMMAEEKKGPQEIKGMTFSKMDMDPAKKDYYAPIWITENVTQEIEKDVRFKQPRMEVKEAKIISMTMRLNLKTTLDQIEKAEKLVKQKDFINAQSEMDKVFSDEIASETVIEDPTFVVWANLMLANDFLQAEEFKSARFTLGKAKEALGRLENAKTLKKDSQSVQELKQELDHMTNVLNERSPTMLMKARSKIKQWSMKVKSWV